MMRAQVKEVVKASAVNLRKGQFFGFSADTVRNRIEISLMLRDHARVVDPDNTMVVVNSARVNQILRCAETVEIIKSGGKFVTDFEAYC